MSTFIQTLHPTPFGFFDHDIAFQTEADGMVTFVKRRLGDDVLSVELTRKQIWSCFEEAVAEYSRHVHEMKIQSILINVMGLPTGSTDLTNVFPQQSLDLLISQASPYASEAYAGNSYDAMMAYINLVPGQQDYNIYNSLLVDVNISGSVTASNAYLTLPASLNGRLKIIEVYHFEPIAAQGSLLNASNITNFLATNFNYESYVNSTVFYVLPVFEDVLRRGMMETAMRVRRSNYSYEIIGSNLRIYPVPGDNHKLWVKVFTGRTVVGGGLLSGTFVDPTLYGISGPSNVPLNNIPFVSITQPGRQWIRQYTLALCKELLGIIRSKIRTIPIPNADLELNGEALMTQGREDQTRLRDQLKEWLGGLTNAKLLAQQGELAASLQANLKLMPMALGKSIIIG